MKRVIVFVTLLAGALCFCIACESSSNDYAAALAPSVQARMAVYNQPASGEEDYQVRAKFIDFEMGDVAHYLFEDEYGEIWDFAEVNNQEEFKFKQALPAEQHNDFNRGWNGNEELQGKWFLLKCTRDRQILYEGGPESDVAIITKASYLY